MHCMGMAVPEVNSISGHLSTQMKREDGPASKIPWEIMYVTVVAWAIILLCIALCIARKVRLRKRRSQDAESNAQGLTGAS